MSSIFVRKYNRAKWEQNNREYHFEETPSDAITNCIKTSGNTLSVWEITDISQIDEAILAIASGMNNLDSIDIIFLDSDFFKTNNIQYEETEGRTPVKSLKNSHRDLSQLTYKSLGLIASHYISQIQSGEVRRITVQRLKEILNKAISNDRLDKNELDEKINYNIVILRLSYYLNFKCCTNVIDAVIANPWRL